MASKTSYSTRFFGSNVNGNRFRSVFNFPTIILPNELGTFELTYWTLMYYENSRNKTEMISSGDSIRVSMNGKNVKIHKYDNIQMQRAWEKHALIFEAEIDKLSVRIQIPIIIFHTI